MSLNLENMPIFLTSQLVIRHRASGAAHSTSWDFCFTNCAIPDGKCIFLFYKGFLILRIIGYDVASVGDNII